MYKLTKSDKQTSHIQAFVWSYITISAWELSILSLTSNQDIIGFPNQSKAFTNSKQNIWIFLIAGNVGSGWQLCMLRNFHWTFSLKWLYLKSELTMLHTCFLMTIYSTCTQCILTEFFSYRGKLGNGEHLSLEAYKENTIYVIIIKQHKEHIKFYPGTHFHQHNFSRYEVMAYKRRWRRSAITCIVGGNCERILVQFVCKVAEFWFVNYFFICWKNIYCFLLMYNWPLCSRILRG